jgi:chemotaxis signal transduction protein
MTTTPALQFTLCEQHYALAIDDVVEVAAMMEAASLASGEALSPALHGVIVRQSQPLMLIDLRRLFGCAAAPVNLATLFIVVRDGDTLAGFIVDAVTGVVHIPAGDVRPVSSGGRVRGVVARDDRLIQWLQVGPILRDVLPHHAND